MYSQICLPIFEIAGIKNLYPLNCLSILLCRVFCKSGGSFTSVSRQSTSNSSTFVRRTFEMQGRKDDLFSKVLICNFFSFLLYYDLSRHRWVVVCSFEVHWVIFQRNPNITYSKIFKKKKKFVKKLPFSMVQLSNFYLSRSKKFNFLEMT